MQVADARTTYSAASAARRITLIGLIAPIAIEHEGGWIEAGWIETGCGKVVDHEFHKYVNPIPEFNSWQQLPEHIDVMPLAVTQNSGPITLTVKGKGMAGCQRRSKNASVSRSKDTSVMLAKRPPNWERFCQASSLGGIVLRRFRTGSA